MSHKIGYIVSRFPNLSETFILREINEFEKTGWNISLYPLILQKQDVIHDEAKPWIEKAVYVPFISIPIIFENLNYFLRRPRKYLSILYRCLCGNISSLKFFIRAIILFPKAIYMAKLMEGEGVEHIHSHYATHPTFVAWVIRELTGIGYTVTVHAHDIFVEQAMLDQKLRDAKLIRAISEYNRKFLSERYGSWINEKTFVVHCGIDPDNFKPVVKKQNIFNKFLLVSIGSLQPYKGFPHLIQACAILRDRSIPLHCMIIGGGEKLSSLKRLIKSYQLVDIVELLGPLTQDEIARLLPEADCYVQPSVITLEGKMEGIPVAIMEALACNLPVVSSSLSGIPELVIDGKTGFLVPPADALALANTLEEVYLNYDYAKSLSKMGRELVLREFELLANVNQLANIFEKEIFKENLSSVLEGK